MGLYPVRRCCCGCSLRTGTILIAAFYLVMYVPMLKAIVVIGFDSHRREEMFKSDAMDGLGTEQKEVAINIAYSSTLAALLFIISMNIMLVVGAVLKNTCLLFIWYVGNIISIFVMCAAVIVMPFSGIPGLYRKLGVSGLLTVIIFLTVYFLTVVHVFLHQIKEGRAKELLEHTRMLQQQQEQQQQQRDQPYRLQQQQQSTQQQQYLQYPEQICMQPLQLEQQHQQQFYQQQQQQYYQHQQQCYQQQQEQYNQQQQEQYYHQQQEQYYHQQQGQQPAYNPVMFFRVASCNPPDSAAPSAPPPT